jgi:hypothetical protein
MSVAERSISVEPATIHPAPPAGGNSRVHTGWNKCGGLLGERDLAEIDRGEQGSSPLYWRR